MVKYYLTVVILSVGTLNMFLDDHYEAKNSLTNGN